MFCQTESKRVTLRSVSTLETNTNIIEGAKFDHKLWPALSGCSDLIAAEAKYHLSCYTSFKRKISKTRDTALAQATLRSLDPTSGGIRPCNLVPDIFVHFTADDIDILDSSL